MHVHFDYTMHASLFCMFRLDTERYGGPLVYDLELVDICVVLVV